MYIHKEKPDQVTSVSSFKLYDLYVSRRTPDIKKPLPADNLIKSKKKILRRTKSCPTRLGNDFEIESKYHCETVVLFLIAHILSLQDVVLRCMFFLILDIMHHPSSR